MNKEELKELRDEVLNSQASPRVQKFCKSSKWRNNRERLINYSLEGRNVLVIGNEAILKKEFSDDFCDSELLNEANGDSEQLLLAYLRQKNSRAYGGCNSLSEIHDIKDLFQDIADVLEEKEDDWWENALEMIDPSLRLLLASKCFRLVITTSFDPILEYAMLRIWGKGLVIKNIHDDVKMIDTDIMTETNRKSEFYDINPTLYYAFGKAVAGISNKMYAVTDDRKIYTIDCWLGSRKPNNLLQYILNKDIIAVGCKFENWVFRFFWYLLGQKPDMSIVNNSYESSYKTGSVAIMLSDNTDDEIRTKSFLRDKQINYYDDSRAFMSLLAPALILEDLPQVGEIFISYASEDFATARNIYDYLKSHKQHVWFDIRLRAGDRYDSDIKEGISQCNIFLPVLSNQTAKDLENNNNRYYRKEWELANSRMLECQKEDEMFLTIPVVIEDYSVKGKYHNETLVPDCIFNSSCFFTKEHVQLAELFNEIEEHRNKWDAKHQAERKH